MRIKKLPLYLRPREKAYLFGVNKLSDFELLALFLKEGTKGKNVLQLAQEILNLNNGLTTLQILNYKKLEKIKGLGKAKIILLLALKEISLRIQKAHILKEKQWTSSKIFKYLFVHFHLKKQEEFLILGFNLQQKLKLVKTCFKGASNHIAIDLKIILKELLDYNIKKFLCVHNHPSGKIKPSQYDLISTQQIEQMAGLLNIQFLDHIIIGEKRAFLIRQNKTVSRNQKLTNYF